MIASAGRYGGACAHKDIAFDFGAWLTATLRPPRGHPQAYW